MPSATKKTAKESTQSNESQITPPPAADIEPASADAAVDTTEQGATASSGVDEAAAGSSTDSAASAPASTSTAPASAPAAPPAAPTAASAAGEAPLSALSDEELLELVENLSCHKRRLRQESAHRLAELAKTEPERLLPHAKRLIDALFRPEAQTRWEVLDTLLELVPLNANAVISAYDGAEAALFDETSATVRLSAFRFLTRFAASNPRRSDKVWPILDEAIQCYHGDPEYRDMLTSLLELANGSLTKACRRALIDRISFDAKSARGYIRSCSAEIVAAAKAKLK